MGRGEVVEVLGRGHSDGMELETLKLRGHGRMDAAAVCTKLAVLNSAAEITGPSGSIPLVRALLVWGTRNWVSFGFLL